MQKLGFFEAFADCIEIMALLEISSLLENKTDRVLASWRHSMRSEDQGYLPFTWKIKWFARFRLCYKISSRMIRVNGKHTWRDILTGKKRAIYTTVGFIWSLED